MIKLIILSFIAMVNSAFCQANLTNLNKEIIEKDSLFWHGYNTCNYTLMEQYLDINVEFYHDKGGLMVGADKVMHATRKIYAVC